MRFIGRPMLIVAALALPLLAACGEDTPATPGVAAPAATTDAATPAAPAKAVTDACAILDAAQVKSVTGKTVTAAPGRSSRIGLSCDYKAGSDTVVRLEFTDSGLFKEPKDAMTVLGVTTGTSEPVSGLGDVAAFLRDDVTTDKLVVVKKGGQGTRSLAIAITDDKPADTKDKTVSLAKAALASI